MTHFIDQSVNPVSCCFRTCLKCSHLIERGTFTNCCWTATLLWKSSLLHPGENTLSNMNTGREHVPFLPQYSPYISSQRGTLTNVVLPPSYYTALLHLEWCWIIGVVSLFCDSCSQSDTASIDSNVLCQYFPELLSALMGESGPLCHTSGMCSNRQQKRWMGTFLQCVGDQNNRPFKIFTYQ